MVIARGTTNATKSASLAVASSVGAYGGLVEHLVPDELWEVARIVIPPGQKRRQGGGLSRIDDRKVMAAIVYAVMARCAWRHIPPELGTSWQTVYRRFREWANMGVWYALCEYFRAGPGGIHGRALAVCEAIRARAECAGALVEEQPLRQQQVAA